MITALGVLVGLVVPVALIAWLVHVVRHARADETRPGLSLRRFLQYAFLFAAVCTAAVGLSGLAELALPAERLAGRSSGELALGLSLSIVALPVSLVLWRVVGRRVADDADERSSTAWSLYLAAAATVAVTVTLVGLVRVGGWAVAGEPFPPGAAGRALVWGVVWAVHLRLVGHRRLSPTGATADLSVLAGSAVGLLALATGTASVLIVALEEVYGALAGGVLVSQDATVTVRHGAVVAVLGAALWWWQWLRQAAAQPRTMLWDGYVLCLPILGGLFAAVGAAAAILHAVLQWTVGVRETDLAAGHFAVVPGALAVGIVGAWAWGYHRAVIAEAAQRRRTEPERAYEYIGAAVGLLAATAGVAVALVALIESLAPAPVATVDPTGRGVLVTAVTLLAVGGPLWWAFWRRLAAPAAGTGPDERESASRRVYLFLLFGAAGLTAVVSLMVTLFEVLRELFDGTLDAGVLLTVRVAMALAVTAGGLSAYHWTVYREDKALRPDQDAGRDRYVLLVAADPGPLAERLRETTGATVRLLRRVQTPSRDTGEAREPDQAAAGRADAVAVDAVTQAVLDCPHPRMVVLVDGDDLRVVPYQPA